MTELDLSKLSLYVSSIIIEDFRITTETISNIGMWHPAKMIEINHKDVVYSFRMQNMPSGCGVCIIYDFNPGISEQMKEGLIQILKHIFRLYALDGAGTIITTYGYKYRLQNHYKFLEELGFKVLDTYPNYRHGRDEQDLLILKTIK